MSPCCRFGTHQLLDQHSVLVLWLSLEMTWIQLKTLRPWELWIYMSCVWLQILINKVLLFYVFISLPTSLSTQALWLRLYTDVMLYVIRSLYFELYVCINKFINNTLPASQTCGRLALVRLSLPTRAWCQSNAPTPFKSTCFLIRQYCQQ